MKEIHLHGHLAEQFGDCYTLDVRDPYEAIQAISVQVPGFRETIQAGNWHVFRGPLDDRQDLDEDGVMVSLGSANEVHVIPAGIGGAVGAVALGAALIAGSYFVAGAAIAGALFAVGVGLMISGAAQMLMSPPQVDSYSDRESPDERPSFLFDGPVNTSTQGLPVPLIYGRMRAGSVVVSAGLSAEDIPLEYEEGGSGGN